MTLREFYLERQRAEEPVFSARLKSASSRSSSLTSRTKRSPSAEQLVWTLTSELRACLDVVTRNQARMELGPRPRLFAEMLEMFEQWSNQLTDRVSKMDEESWKPDRAVLLRRQGRIGNSPWASFLWFITV